MKEKLKLIIKLHNPIYPLPSAKLHYFCKWTADMCLALMKEKEQDFYAGIKRTRELIREDKRVRSGVLLLGMEYWYEGEREVIENLKELLDKSYFDYAMEQTKAPEITIEPYLFLE